jgi:hypothetical protein
LIIVSESWQIGMPVFYMDSGAAASGEAERWLKASAEKWNRFSDKIRCENKKLRRRARFRPAHAAVVAEVR